MVVDIYMAKMVCEVAREAGLLLKANARTKQCVTTETEWDVKLQVDLDTERLIKKRLSGETSFAVIGEEEGGDAELLQRDEFYWVIDPLDGTYNYLRGQPLACVSIGLMRGESYVLGVVYDFFGDTIYYGSKEIGLFMNDERMNVNWEQDMERGCLVSGFSSVRSEDSEQTEEYMAMMRRFRKVRMLGTATMGMVYVAMGWSEVFYERGINLWDVAAAAALVEAAGGAVRLKPRSKSLKYDVWAVGRQEWLDELYI